MEPQPGKYARYELERRFLASGPPPAGAEVWRIVDRYLDGTRLRLRRMDPVGGGEPVLKLGQKIAPRPPDTATTVITTIYLDAAEFAALLALSGHELRKERHRLREGGRELAIDVFDGALSGLVLVEAAVGPDELSGPLDLPAWIGREVSSDPRFTGAALARAAPERAAELVRESRHLQ
jgi:CYTH domain-containing protein